MPFGGGVTCPGARVVLTSIIGFLAERLTGSLKLRREAMIMVELSEPPCGMVRSCGKASMEKSGSVGRGGLFDAQTSQIVPFVA